MNLIQKLKHALQAPQADEVTINLELATAALMIEIMAADMEWQDNESDTIKQLLQQEFSLNANDIDELFDSSKQAQQEANDLYQFTKVVNENLGREQRFELMKKLWVIANADDQIDRYEEHMIRKIADLLHMPHSLYMQAKLAVLEQ